ncbi:MAG: MBL fold metallo-hydrolase [Chitinophagales bacterium]
MTKYLYYILLLCLSQTIHAQPTGTHIIVLGVAQDGGYPHTGCTKQCCTRAWEHDSMKRYVVSLALVDPESKRWWLFEATPDIKQQLHYFQTLTKRQYSFLPDGIFITHAHIGHYTGLMELGREVMNTKDVPVYVLPKMKAFLESNGPWSQLVKLHNIDLREMKADTLVNLSGHISVSAFTVPHRDEYSETAGFKIITENKKYLFIPDINKWEDWNRKIIDEVKGVDIAMLDATFYGTNGLPGRNISEVPHPFVSETMNLFKNESKDTRSKIHFIHINHTNPLLWDTQTQNEVKQAGFNIALQGQEL